MKNLPFDKPGQFWKGNLHTHSTVSDADLPPEAVSRRYREGGYHFLAITDHFLEEYGFPIVDTTPYRTDHFTTLIGAELKAWETETGGAWDILAVGLPFDFAPAAPGETAASLAARALDAGAFVAAAHPHHSHLTPGDILALGPIHAIEIFNGVADSVDRGDGSYIAELLFTQGHHYLTIAVDDAHFEDFRSDFGLGWVWVKSEDLSPEAILAALKAGFFYSSMGPEIHDVQIIPPDTVHVRCSPVDRIMLAGDGGESKSTEGEGITEGYLTRRHPSPWMRVIIRDRWGKRAWTNPFWF